MSKRFRKLSHPLYECKYHVVFCPKYRHRIFKDGVAEYTRQQIYQLLRQKDGLEALELNVQAEHIHLVAVVATKVRGFRGDGLFEREVGHQTVPPI